MKNPNANVIIKRMVRLKQMRHSREEFFELWGKLRHLLYLTPEYKTWLVEVRNKTGHKCARENCTKRGRDCHHIIRVYSDPTKALDIDNGEYLCYTHHKKEHADGTGRVRHVRNRRAKQSVSN